LSAVGTYFSLFVLAVATIDDVLTRRVHNALLLGLALVSIGVIYWVTGVAGIRFGVLGFLTGLALYFPLAWFGIVGGGDLKLLAVVGLTAGPINTVTIAFFALFWGSLIGLFQTITSGEFKSVARNILTIAKMKKPEAQKLHRLPFAAAMLLAGLTQWTLNKTGGWI